MALSNSELRRAWADYECQSQKMTVISFGDDRIRVAPPTSDAWRALAAVFERHNYQIRPQDTDSYNCRQITGGVEKSLHAYGIALDVNWTTNPFKRTSDKRATIFARSQTQAARALEVKRDLADTDMTMEMIRDVEAIRTKDGKQVFEWGGNWRTIKDAMHFEIQLSPQDLSVGIEGRDGEGDQGNFSRMSPNFKKCHLYIQKWEGGWSNDKDDPGRATNWGITQATLSDWLGRPASAGDVFDLTREEAERIYYDRYWQVIRGDQLPSSLALLTYNAAVNSGPMRGGQFLQEALNVTGARLEVDGIIGPKSLHAAATSDQVRTVQAFRTLHEKYYRSLQHFWKFGKGWLNRLSDIGSAALAFARDTQSDGYQKPDRPDQPEADTRSPARQKCTCQKEADWSELANALATAALEIARLYREGQNQSQVQQQPPDRKPRGINMLLGRRLGKLLNGKKTVLGAAGVLVTQVLPLLFPQAGPVISVVEELSQPFVEANALVDIHNGATFDLLQVFFTALLGWGVLGKFEKWFEGGPSHER